MSTSRRFVVNVAVRGRENYPLGQARLKASLQKSGYDGETLFFDHWPKGSPSHSQVPYAFKYYAMQQAFDRGADLVMWLDAAVVVLRPTAPLWQILKAKGILLFRNRGCPCHRFTAKRTLDKLGCFLQEAKGIEQVYGGVVGYNRHNSTAMSVFRRMQELSRDSVSFVGGGGSSYPEFIAHRHDQSCLSIIAHRRKLPKQEPGYLKYSRDVKPDTILELRGVGAP
jgi:hypothetical protein